MLLVADTHVHLYPCYDLVAALGQGYRNLRALAAGARRDGTADQDVALALCLAEGAGHHVFRELKEARLRLPPPLEVQPAVEPETLVIAGAGEGPLHLLAGRQIVTRERLELLALGRDAELADGRPIADVLSAIRDSGTVPVLNWAPGKWFFARGRIVARLIEEATAGELAVCDTTLRPRVWPEPRLMLRARTRGLPRVAGSDPLPLAGEERYVGSYGIIAGAGKGQAGPAAALRGLLAGGSFPIRPAGRRLGLVTVARRLARHRDAKRKSAF